MIVTVSIDEDEQQALSDVRAWATSQAAQFDRWKKLPDAWEKFRPEFKEAKQKYHFKDHLSLRAEHKEIISDEMVQNVAIAGNLDYCVECEGVIRKRKKLENLNSVLETLIRTGGADNSEKLVVTLLAELLAIFDSSE